MLGAYLSYERSRKQEIMSLGRELRVSFLSVVSPNWPSVVKCVGGTLQVLRTRQRGLSPSARLFSYVSTYVCSPYSVHMYKKPRNFRQAPINN